MTAVHLDVGCLRLFAAAARLGNLSRAAVMMGVTQPALSYRIRQMEEALGAPLFLRRHRGLELTAAGEELYDAVSQGLDKIDRAIGAIGRKRVTPTVRLATDFGFAAARLMPKMAEFRLINPDIEVHIVATQSLTAAVHPDIDLAIVFGSREDFRGEAALIIPERVTTVCTAGFAARYGPFGEPADLLGVPLIHLDSPDKTRWFEWDRWLAAAGVPGRSTVPAIGFNTYTLVVQAALSDQGVALGWLGLVDDLLESGALVRACDLTLTSDRGYWLLRPSRPQAREVEVVAAWLRAWQTLSTAP